jgi:subtilisin-like proprotein convertase family protein
VNIPLRRFLILCFVLFALAAGAQAQSCSTVSNTTTCSAANGLVSVGGNSGGRAVAGTYPLQLTVPSLSGTIQNIQVSLNGLTSTSTFSGGDFMVLLVSPTGEKLEILSHYCNDSSDITGINLVLDDTNAGTAKVNGPSFGNCSGVASGTFHTTAGFAFATTDTFPTPAPVIDAAHTAQPHGTGTLLSTFTGNPTGTWSLYVAMQSGGFNTGSLGSAGTPAWRIALTMNAASSSTTTTLTRTQGSSPALNTDSLKFHAVVAPAPTGGTVNFQSDSVNIAGCAGLALGIDCTTTLPEGAHNITACTAGQPALARVPATPYSRW